MTSCLIIMNIIINNITWKIKFIPEDSGDLRRDNGTSTIGMTDNNIKMIFLSDQLYGSLLYHVLCHELVHAFCFSYDIYIEDQEEERLANFIATYGRSILNLTDDVLGDMIKSKIA